MAGSSLYLGRVRHRRAAEPRREFSYRVWYALLDLDEIPTLAETIPLFAHNRFHLVSFDDRDHLGWNRRPVRTKLRSWLVERGVDADLDQIQLLTHLRMLGSVFNPVSFFFCRDRFGELQLVVAEVQNTFGESYCYLLRADSPIIRHEDDKAFHVSPFQPLAGRYRFRITPPGDCLTVHIELLRDGGRAFDATLTLDRRPFTNASLAATVARHPHTGLRTLGLIHLQALRLWLRRAPFFSKPRPPAGAWRTRS